MHYLLLTFSLILHYLYRYNCILNVFMYVYGQLSAIKNLLSYNWSTRTCDILKNFYAIKRFLSYILLGDWRRHFKCSIKQIYKL